VGVGEESQQNPSTTTFEDNEDDNDGDVADAYNTTNDDDLDEKLADVDDDANDKATTPPKSVQTQTTISPWTHPTQIIQRKARRRTR